MLKIIGTLLRERCLIAFYIGTEIDALCGDILGTFYGGKRVSVRWCHVSSRVVHMSEWCLSWRHSLTFGVPMGLSD